jgi:[protein-PII] uridylyltransferase
VAEGLWYPLWDGGIKLSPAAHTTKSLLQLATDDLETATSILRLRCLAGDHEQVNELRDAALGQWRRKPHAWLQRLADAGEQRWQRFGDVASLLEPDLKDGRGGLRDHDMIRWALAADRPDVTEALECPFDDLAGSADILLAARCELHRTTGRTANVLLLQEQDRVAETMGYADADTLMLTISSAAHSIEWAGERFWRRIERVIRKGARGETHTARPLPDHVAGVSVLDGEVQVSLDADIDEQSFVFRAAAAAAHQGHPLGGRSLRLLASRGYEPDEVWSERTRRAFVSLLGAGQAVVSAVESLEQYDLFSRFLPEWRHVRSRPQRNAFHTYTIDRHLLQTVANASDLLRDVARPDLLLVGALLHDIGKGRAGDHTEVGMALVDTIGPRMGFPDDDVAILRSLVEHHLLLSETATRRDLSDPRTALNVADAVGDLGRLELLHALTVADSRATGPAAWSAWKAGLVDDLVRVVTERLRGQPFAPDQTAAERRFAHLAQQVRSDGALHIEHENVGDFDVLRIASRDRPGLFAVIAGTLAVHGLDVVGADAFTLAGGAAVDEFRIMRIGGGSPNWAKIEHGLLAVLSGEVDIEARLDQRVRTYGRARRRAVAAAPPRLEVLISNDASDSTTVIDVRAPDGVAVLYRLSRTITDHGVDIRSAKVSTLGHEVVDVFYVQLPGSVGGMGGQIPADRHDAIRSSLKAALVD